MFGVQKIPLDTCLKGTSAWPSLESLVEQVWGKARALNIYSTGMCAMQLRYGPVRGPKTRETPPLSVALGLGPLGAVVKELEQTKTERLRIGAPPGHITEARTGVLGGPEL